MSGSELYDSLFERVKAHLLDRDNLAKYLIVFPNAQGGWTALSEGAPPNPKLIARGTGSTVADALTDLLNRGTED